MVMNARIRFRKLLLLLAAAAALCWIASYWFQNRVALIPFGDTALGRADARIGIPASTKP